MVNLFDNVYTNKRPYYFLWNYADRIMLINCAKTLAIDHYKAQKSRLTGRPFCALKKLLKSKANRQAGSETKTINTTFDIKFVLGFIIILYITGIVTGTRK